MSDDPQVGPALHARPVLCARPGCGIPWTWHHNLATWICRGFLWVPPIPPGRSDTPTG